MKPHLIDPKEKKQIRDRSGRVKVYRWRLMVEPEWPGRRRTMADYGIVEKWWKKRIGPKDKENGGKMVNSLGTF